MSFDTGNPPFLVEIAMKQQEVLKNIIPELRANSSITAVMLMGSVAAGTEYPTSDLNLFLLGDKNKFDTDLIDDIYVECLYVTHESARSRLDKRGSEVYRYLGSKIIYDLDGRLIKLMRAAMNKYKNYKASEKEKADLRHWLYSTKIKLDTAIKSQNEIKADYVTTVSTWKCIEAIFIINDIPVPPYGRVMQELSNLKHIPGNGWFAKIFEKDVKKRTEALLYIIDWVLTLL